MHSPLPPAQSNDIQWPGAAVWGLLPCWSRHFRVYARTTSYGRPHDSLLQMESMGFPTLKMRRFGCSFTHSAMAPFPILGVAHARLRMGTSPSILECARSTAQCWDIAVSNGKVQGGKRTTSQRIRPNTARLRHSEWDPDTCVGHSLTAADKDIRRTPP